MCESAKKCGPICIYICWEGETGRLHGLEGRGSERSPIQSERGLRCPNYSDFSHWTAALPPTQQANSFHSYPFSHRRLLKITEQWKKDTGNILPSYILVTLKASAFKHVIERISYLNFSSERWYYQVDNGLCLLRLVICSRHPSYEISAPAHHC